MLGPVTRPTGTTIHSKVLPAFGQANAGLFTEVAIPGAVKGWVQEEKVGAVDFWTGGNTVALQMVQGEPVLVDSDKDLKKSGKKFPHLKEGAPIPSQDADPPCLQGKVCRINKAPGTILLGDLKPGGGGVVEAFLGDSQLNNYATGLTNNAKALADYLKIDPKRGHPVGASWSPTVKRIPRLKVPAQYAFGTANTMERSLALFHENGGMSPPLSGFQAPLTVYKHPTLAGIWVYEWIPKKVPESVKQNPKTSDEFKGVLKRLDELTASLSASPKKKAKKALPGARALGPRTPRTPRAHRWATAAPRVQPMARRLIQRKAKPFDPAVWPGEYTTWKTEAKKFLGGKAAADLRLAGAFVDMQERTGLSLGVPAAVQQGVKEFGKVERWERWGGLFGRLRKTFGGLYTKVGELYESAAKRLKALRESTSAKGDSKGDKLLAAIFKVAWTVASTFFRVVTDKVLQRLRAALDKGAEVVVTEFFGEKNVEAVLEAKTDLEAMAKKWEASAVVDLKARLDILVKPYEEDLKFIADLGRWLGDVSKIVSAVRWAARVVQCLTPPAVGCLKLLLQAVAEKALEMVVETCWFQKYIVAPLFNAFDFIKKLPDRLANAVIEQVRNLLPFEEALKDKLLPVGAMGAVALTTADLDCDDKHLSPEAIAMRKLLDKHGRKKVEELIKLMEKAGVGEQKALDLANIRQMDAALDALTLEQLQTAVATYTPGESTGPLADLVKSVQGAPTVGGGGGGAKDEGAPALKSVPASQAKYDGKGGPTQPRGGVKVTGATLEDASRKETSVTLLLFVDGEAVMTVPGVPARVDKVEDVTVGGKAYKKLYLILLQGVQFKHEVPGLNALVLEKGTEMIKHVAAKAVSGSDGE